MARTHKSNKEQAARVKAAVNKTKMHRRTNKKTDSIIKRNLLLFLRIILISPINAFDRNNPAKFSIQHEFEIVSYYDIVPSDSIDLFSITKPAYDFYAKFNCPIELTIDTIFRSDSSDSLTININSNHPCYVFIIEVGNNITENPQTFFVNSFDNKTGQFRKTIKVFNDQSLFTRLIVTRNMRTLSSRSSVNPNPGGEIHPLGLNDDKNVLLSESISNSQNSSSCFVNIISESDISFVPINITGALGGNIWKLNYVIEDHFSHETVYDCFTLYNIFTCQSTTDVECFVLDRNYNIVHHLTDYVGSGNFDWGTDVRLTLSPDSIIYALMMLPQLNYNGYFFDDYSLFPSTSGKTDLYIGCKNYLWPTTSLNEPVFPYMEADDAIVSDPARFYGYGDYNCFAWSIGCWFASLNYLNVVNPYHHYNPLFESLGYTTTGATEDNCDIDIWEHNGLKTHASVRSYSNGANGHSYGYAWESKNGPGGARFMHPRYAIGDTDPSHWYAYGQVVEHLIKVQGDQQVNFILENCEFSGEEYSAIDNMTMGLKDDDTLYFEETLKTIEETIRYFGISNLSLLNLYLDDYKELARKCSNNEQMLGYAMKKLSEGNTIAAYLIADATKEKNYELVASIAREEIKKIEESNNPKIIPTTISSATRYAKALLANQKVNAPNLEKEKERLSYSNSDDSFTVKATGNTIQISLLTERVSLVTLVVEDMNGGNRKILLNQARLGIGFHEKRCEMIKNGTYIVYLDINGRIYSKKILLD